MKKYTIKATFKGANSLGYENGKEYELRVAESKGVSIERIDGTGKCPYESLSSFFKNWNGIVTAKNRINEPHKSKNNI